MKTNAIIRIIIWSLVFVLLVSILAAGLLFRNHRLNNNSPAETAIPTPLSEIPPISAGEFPITCDTEATVTSDGLNVRSAPSSISEAIDMVKKGDIVSINRGVEIGDQLWLGIYSPVTGWIKAEYVDSLENVVFYSSEELRSETYIGSSDAVTANVTEEVNLHAAPSEDTPASSILHPGDTVTIGRYENVGGETWAFITSPQGGWVQAKYLKTVESTTDSQISSDDISLDARQIREIDIEWAAGDITIETADVDSIQISESEPAEPKYAMVWKQNNDTLTIRFCEDTTLNFDFGISLRDVVSKDLTILVPVGWECDSLEINVASATLTVTNMVIKEVDFDGASGTSDFDNCIIDEMDLDTASGDVSFTGSLDILDCDAASASVTAVLENIPSRIDMDSMSGDLDLTLPENAGFKVSMDGMSSEFNSDFETTINNGNYICGDGSCKITMAGMSGDLYIRKNTTIPPVSEVTDATEIPAVTDASGTHHHTEACYTAPDSCPDNNTHHDESHHN
nr:DUF4097 family beta strand repeat protein [Oscillospiraceae bacterium]